MLQIFTEENVPDYQPDFLNRIQSVSSFFFQMDIKAENVNPVGASANLK